MQRDRRLSEIKGTADIDFDSMLDRNYLSREKNKGFEHTQELDDQKEKLTYD